MQQEILEICCKKFHSKTVQILQTINLLCFHLEQVSFCWKGNKNWNWIYILWSICHVLVKQFDSSFRRKFSNFPLSNSEPITGILKVILSNSNYINHRVSTSHKRRAKMPLENTCSSCGSRKGWSSSNKVLRQHRHQRKTDFQVAPPPPPQP